MIMPGITTASIKTSQKDKVISPALGPMFLFQKFQMDSSLCLMEPEPEVTVLTGPEATGPTPTVI